MTEQNNNINNVIENIQPKKSNKRLIFVIIGFVLAILIALLLYVLVFNKKTLSCILDEKNVEFGLSANLEINFKKDEVSKANINMVFNLGDYASYKDDILTQLKEQYSKDFNDMNLKVSSDDEKIYIKMQATKDNFEGVGFGTAGTYEEVKHGLESQGFVCK